MEMMLGGGGEEVSTSGCQSGWTVYFDQSYQPHMISLPSKKHEQCGSQKDKEEEEDDDDDDSLSMVSDASSGPPHLDLEEIGCICTASSSFPSNVNAMFCDVNMKKRKVDHFLEKQQDFSAFFDDTASSPLFFTYDGTNGVIAETEIMRTESSSESSCSFSATNPIMYSEKKTKRRSIL